MFDNFQSVIKKQSLFIFILVHLGLGVGIFSVGRESSVNGWSLNSTLFSIAMVCLYIGFVFGVLFVLMPLLPWLRRAQRAEHWTERLIGDLPQIILAVQGLMTVWNQTKENSPDESPIAESFHSEDKAL